MFIEEDIIPVRPWAAEQYLGMPAVLEGPQGHPWWGFTGIAAGPPRPLMYSKYSLIPQRIVSDGGCPDWLPKELCQPAIEANAKITGDHFLHVDKFSSRHGPNPAKERLILALAEWVSRQKPASESAAGPSFARRAVNFTKAAGRHIANRGRQCTDEEIAARYAKCEACPGEWRVGDTCTHPKCGCGISPKRALVSKLSWASESCPIGEWQAISAVDT